MQKRRKPGYKPKRKRRPIQTDVPKLITAGKWALEIAAVCLVAFAFVFCFGNQVSMVGGSMEPVLENGNVVLTNCIVYNAVLPGRGDIIAFKPKGNENAYYYIRRIVGLPGEKVEVLEDAIYIDGEKLEEEYGTTGPDGAGLLSEPVELGEDEYFVLGDDRTCSEDSRSPEVGLVKREYIYGKVWFILSPGQDFGFLKG